MNRDDLLENDYACAFIRGVNIRGDVSFFHHDNGIMVTTQISGFKEGFGTYKIVIKDDNMFHETMPAILSSDGYAYLRYYTKKFTIQDLNGKKLIVYDLNNNALAGAVIMVRPFLTNIW